MKVRIVTLIAAFGISVVGNACITYNGNSGTVDLKCQKRELERKRIELLKTKEAISNGNINLAFRDRAQRGMALNLLKNVIYTTTKVGKYAELSGLDKYISDGMSKLVNSRFSDEVQVALNNKLDKFSKEYKELISRQSFSINDAISFNKFIVELDSELSKIDSNLLTTDEVEIIEETKKSLSLFSKNIILLAIDENGRVNEHKMKKLLLENKIDINDINSSIKEITKILKDENSVDSHQINIQRISERTLFADSLTRVASKLGVISVQDEYKMRKAISGIAQISEAVSAFNNAGALALGPYGLAIAGTMTVVDAISANNSISFEKAIMNALQAISKQIQKLHQTVERRFDELSDQLSITEFNLMEKLSDIISNQDIILSDLEVIKYQLKDISDKIDQINYENKLFKAQTFFNKLTYEDDSCLKKLRYRTARRKCLNHYQEITKEFEIEYSRLLTSLDQNDQTNFIPSYNENLNAFINIANEYEYGLKPVSHFVFSKELFERVHLFLSYNQRILRNNSTMDLLKKIERLKREQETFIKKLNDSKKITSLNEEYKKELERVTEELNKVKSHYLRNNPVSKEEEIAIDYLRNINNHPINKRLDLFNYNVDKNKHLYANIEERTTMRTPSFFGTSIPFRTRIKHNRIDIRLKKIKTTMSNPLDLYKRFRKEDLSGYIWINQCKQATDMGYPSFPVLRDTLTKDLPKELIELTKLNSNAVNICYRPLIKKGPSTNMAIGNSDSGMGLVRSRVSSTVLENMQGLCNKRTAKNYFKNIYYKFSEFKNAGRNEFEKCHKRHLHHWVHSSMPQVLGYKFEITLNLTGVESPIKTFKKEYLFKFKNQKYDRCFLLNDKSGRLSKDSIFAPFLYQYMFPVTSSCTGVESAFLKTLKHLRSPINHFLANDMTNTNDINRESITYQDALRKTVAFYRQKNHDQFKRIQEKWLNDNVGPDSKLGKLSYLINGIGYFSSLSEKSKLLEINNVYHLSELHYHLLNPKSFYEWLFAQE